MCNFGLRKAAVAPPDNKSVSENPVVRVYIAVNDILQIKSQHLIRVLAFMTMGLFLQVDKVFLVQVHSFDSSQ